MTNLKIATLAAAATLMCQPVYAKETTPSKDDVRYSAATIIGEAWSEPEIGQLAVLEVLECRAQRRGTTLKHEALRPQQFSAWNTNEPLSDEMHALAEGRGSGRSDMDRDYTRILNLVSDAAQSKDRQRILPPNTCHYWAHNTMKEPPYWYNGEQTIIIGDHTFAIGIK